MYRFRVAGEYYDAKSEGAMISGGSFKTLREARNAAGMVVEYMKDPVNVQLPADLMEVAEVTDSPEVLEVALYKTTSDGLEEWMISFNIESGEPTQMTDDVDVLWDLAKKGLK